MKAWYVFYTYPRAEKKAHQWLVEKGYEVFLPLKEKVHYWKNRQKKIIYDPIFPGYIFVRIFSNRIHFVLQNPRIVKCLTFESTPSILSDMDILLIREMIEPGNNLLIEKDDSIGSRVMIGYGPFKGCKGTLMNHRENKRVRIQLNSIPYAIGVDVDENCVKRIE